MSGGFFRGTSADQDTRFSNKQAKLLKSQKFAPELDHLVDMSKVKMDVMRPWIANRVTELIGFEDEVLINFIYSLLDGKEVNGKEVQISLTGFMERNTGKFMKELWALLLSAQKNTSGVPQQFLDAKEEETKKKKAESDRIANEIQRKKEREGQELERERNRKMDVVNDTLKGDNTVKEPARESRARSADEEPKGRNGSRGRNLVTKSPHSADRSSPPRRMRSRSPSKSFSNSRSYSNERHRSRSLSASPKQRRRSSSPEMIRRSSPKRSLTPRRRRSPRRSLTPPRRRSSYSRRRLSPSPTRYRMRSPRRRRSRSPSGRRSRSPIRRRSRSPIWRSYVRNRSLSPVRRRSPSPGRRRSPSPGRRRSPSPGRRRSPSPVRRRSPYPMRHRSPSPMRKRYRGSPLSPQLRSPSPVRRRSPISSRRRSPSPVKSRSRSSHDWSSPSPVKDRSPLPSRRRSPKRQRSPVESHRPRKRDFEEDSPGRHASPRSGARRRSKSIERSRSDSLDRGTPRKVKAFSPSPLMSSPVPEHESKICMNDDARSNGHPRSSMDKSNVKISNACSPPRTSREYKPSHSSERSADDKVIDNRREDDKWSYRSKGTSKALDQPKGSRHTDDKDELSPQRLDGSHPAQTHSHTGRTDSNEKKIDPSSDQHHDAMPRLSGKVDQKDQSSFEGSGSEEIDKKRSKVKGRRKNKRPERQRSESEDESSYDSSEEERKEAKKRRKVERRSRKEEKKRRREERRRKKEERRAEKLKLKSIDTVYSHSDAEGNHDNDADGHQNSKRLQSHRKNVEQAEPEHKRLEIELREKALENLRAKKNIH